jgi:hypothetical protein
VLSLVDAIERMPAPCQKCHPSPTNNTACGGWRRGQRGSEQAQSPRKSNVRFFYFLDPMTMPLRLPLGIGVMKRGK